MHYDSYNTSDIAAERTVFNANQERFIWNAQGKKETWKGGPETVPTFNALKSKEEIILGPLQTDRATRVAGSIWTEKATGVKMFIEQSFDWQPNLSVEIAGKIANGSNEITGVSKSVFAKLSNGSGILEIPGVIGARTYITSFNEGEEKILLSSKAAKASYIYGTITGIGHWDVLEEIKEIKAETSTGFSFENIAPVVRARIVNGTEEQKVLRAFLRTFNKYGLN